MRVDNKKKERGKKRDKSSVESPQADTRLMVSADGDGGGCGGGEPQHNYGLQRMQIMLNNKFHCILLRAVLCKTQEPRPEHHKKHKELYAVLPHELEIIK